MNPSTSYRLFVLFGVVAASVPGCRCDPKLDRDRPLAHCKGARPGKGQFSFVATIHPPKLTFEPTCDARLPLEAGRFRFDPVTRVLSGRVRLYNRGSARSSLVAFVDFLADDEGDKRFEPHLSTTASVVTREARRGFVHGDLKAGEGAWAHWAFVVPRGVGGRFRGAGWVDEQRDTAVWIELEELAAGSAEGRPGPGGWRWLHRIDDYSGWGVLRVQKTKRRRPLRRAVRLPRAGRYQVLLVGGRRRPAGVELKIGSLKVDVGSAQPAGRGRWLLGSTQLGRRTELSLLHRRKRGATLDAMLLIPERESASSGLHKLPRALPPFVLGSRRLAREMFPRFLRRRLAQTRRTPRTTSADQWKTRVPRIRAALRRALDLPPHRANASSPRVRHLGSVKRGSLVVEKLFIEGVAGLWASALLYRPAKATGRLPAVLHALGHYGRGKHYRPSLIFDANLAARGMVVLSVDALGLGERVVGKEDHHFQGMLHWLVGRSPTREMVGEMIRFVDYLRSRPDVDPRRIGMTGSSGGGTLTLYTTAVDPRIAASAPLAAVADWKWLFRFIGGDPEMYPRDVVRQADYATLLRLAAPRPVLVGVGRRDDMFPPRAARRVVRRARDVYGVLGYPDRLSLFVDSYPHGLKPGRRKATYRFFQKHLSTGTPPIPEDISLALFPVITGRPPALRSLVDGAREGARDLPSPLSPGATPADARQAQTRRRKALETLLARPGNPTPKPLKMQPYRRFFRRQFSQVGYRSEDGIRMPALTVRSLTGRSRGTLVYVSDSGRFSAVHAVSLAQAGYDVVAVDLPGIGETTPGRRYRYGLGRPGALFMQDFFGAACLNVLGDSLYALRVDFLRRVIRTLIKKAPNTLVGVVGQGTESGVYALTVAALEPGVAGAAALGPLHSFKQEIQKARFPAPGLAAYGILSAVDLPELMALVAPRPLLVLGGRTSNGARVKVNPSADYVVPRAFYGRLGRRVNLQVDTNLAPPREQLLRWAAKLSAVAR